MADPKITWTADDKDVVRALDKMTAKMNGLLEANRKLAQESKRGSDAAKSGFANMADDIKETVTGYFGISAAIGLGTAALKKMVDETERLGKVSREAQQSTLKGITAAGDLASADRINQWAGSMKGVTRQQAMTAYERVSAATPLSSLDERLGIAGQTAALAPTGRNLETVSELAGELRDFKPGASGNDLADLAAKLQDVSGADAGAYLDNRVLDSLKGLHQTGAMSPEQLLGLATQAKDANLPSSSLGALADAVLKDDSSYARKRGERMTPEVAMRSRFGKMSDSEQLQSLLSDRQMRSAIGVDEGIGRIDMDVANRVAEDLRNAQKTDYAQQTVRDLRKSELGRGAIAEQAVAAAADAGARKAGDAEAPLQRSREYVAARGQQLGGSAGGLTLGAIGRVDQVSGIIGPLAGGSLTPTGAIAGGGADLLRSTLQRLANALERGNVNIDAHTE